MKSSRSEVGEVISGIESSIQWFGKSQKYTVREAYKQIILRNLTSYKLACRNDNLKIIKTSLMSLCSTYLWHILHQLNSQIEPPIKKSVVGADENQVRQVR